MRNKKFRSILYFNFIFLFLITKGINSVTNTEIAYVKDNKQALKPENKFNKKRINKVKTSLEKLFDIKLEDDHNIPNISICCSGGGLRSAIATLGALDALQDLGLLDCATHISALSGSTWAVMPWMIENKPIKEFKYEFISRLGELNKIRETSNLNPAKFKKMYDFFIGTQHIFNQIKKNKAEFGQSVNLIDWYGIILSDLLLNRSKPEQSAFTLSDIAKNISPANYPLPIFTAVTQFKNKTYEWLEFTPYTVGCSIIDSYIPTWAFGRKFMDGKSISFAPESQVGYLMAIFGSAFCPSLKDLFHKISIMKLPEKLQSFFYSMETKISTHKWGNRKFAVAQVANYTFGTQNAITKNPKMSVVDSGYHCNLPLQPLLSKTRKSDIIFVIDNTSQNFVQLAIALKEAESQAKQNGDKFPPIDYTKIKTENFCVFKDENDKECPILIYIPLKKDPGYSKDFSPKKARFCRTSNFFYSKQEAELLAGLPEYVIKEHKDKIYNVIRDKINETIKPEILFPTTDQMPGVERVLQG